MITINDPRELAAFLKVANGVLKTGGKPTIQTASWQVAGAMIRANPLVETLIDRYLCDAFHPRALILARARSMMAHWSRELGKYTIKNLCQAHVERIVAEYAAGKPGRSGRPLGHGSQVALIVALRKFLRWCAARGYLHHGAERLAAVPQRQAKRKTPDSLTDEEYAAVLRSLALCRDGRHSRTEREVVIRLCGDCGMRPAEAYYLTWAEIRMDARVIVLAAHEGRRLKNVNAGRDIPIPERVYSLLCELQVMSDGPTVIGRAASHDRRAQANHPWKTIQEHVRRCSGVARFTFALLRHTFASRYIRHHQWSDLAYERLADYMGHGDSAMTRAFYIARPGLEPIELPDVLAATAPASRV